MPVTSTSSDTPPTVEVKVTNGGGGGADHFVGVFVCWNPNIMDASAPVPSSGAVFKKKEGFCVWHGKIVPSGNDDEFRLTMCRKTGGPTWVLACSMDPVTGAFSQVERWTVPEDHPMCSASASKKKSKKKRKAK